MSRQELYNAHVLSQKISIHLNYQLDDSYTPSTLAIRAGTGPSDLQDVRVVTLDKPEGWITFDVSSEPNEDGDGLQVLLPFYLDFFMSMAVYRNPVYAYVLQIIIAANHMSGKDTHVRGLRVLGALEYVPNIFNLGNLISPIIPETVRQEMILLLSRHLSIPCTKRYDEKGSNHIYRHLY